MENYGAGAGDRPDDGATTRTYGRATIRSPLALLHEPSLLLLDEPYSGFDWETYLRFSEMSEARRDAGMAILIVSHLLAERERLDRVLELRQGRVVAG